MIIRLIIAGIIVRVVMLILQWENERPRKEGKKQTSSIYKFDMRCPIYMWLRRSVWLDVGSAIDRNLFPRWVH